MTQTAPQPSTPEGQHQGSPVPQPPQANGPAVPQSYGPPGYVQPAPGPQYYMPAPAPAENGFGTTGLVLGIIGLVFSWVPGLNLLLGVLATVFGALGWRKGRARRATNGGPALAGMIMGIITIVIAIGLAILVGMSLPTSG
jgi:hypothetical protein